MRKGELRELVPLQVEGKQRLAFEAPSRGLIGFRSAFATLTRGTGLMHRAFAAYGPFRGPLDRVRKGVLVSTAGARARLGLARPCQNNAGRPQASAPWAGTLGERVASAAWADCPGASPCRRAVCRTSSRVGRTPAGSSGRASIIWGLFCRQRRLYSVARVLGRGASAASRSRGFSFFGGDYLLRAESIGWAGLPRCLHAGR